MQKRIVDGVEVRRSSGNVFADLGVPDADKLKVKTDLAIEIRKAMKVHGLTQTDGRTRLVRTSEATSVPIAASLKSYM